MAKSIITQDGDLVNYDNLVAISVEERAVGFDEEHSEDEYCIIGTDVKNGEILLYREKKITSAERRHGLTRYLDEKTGGKGVIFATGTPYASPYLSDRNIM